MVHKQQLSRLPMPDSPLGLCLVCTMMLKGAVNEALKGRTDATVAEAEAMVVMVHEAGKHELRDAVAIGVTMLLGQAMNAPLCWAHLAGMAAPGKGGLVPAGPMEAMAFGQQARQK
jgi:hypothetical protein